MAVSQFEDLEAWQLAMELTVEVYGFLEKSALGRNRILADQVWRSTVSISSNIAEGFEKFTRPEFARYLGIAKGSAGELRSQLHIAIKVGLLPPRTAIPLIKKSQHLSNLIGALRASVERKHKAE